MKITEGKEQRAEVFELLPQALIKKSRVQGKMTKINATVYFRLDMELLKNDRKFIRAKILISEIALTI